MDSGIAYGIVAVVCCTLGPYLLFYHSVLSAAAMLIVLHSPMSSSSAGGDEQSAYADGYEDDYDEKDNQDQDYAKIDGEGGTTEDVYYEDEDDYDDDDGVGPKSAKVNKYDRMYHEHEPSGYEPAPYHEPSYPPPSYHPPPYYPPPYHQPTYHEHSYPPSSYHPPSNHKPHSYKPKKKKVKKVYVPVYVPDKEKKKMKILSVDKGFYIAGGSQLYGKFKSLKKCMKACAKTPSCFGGDYNPWLHKCYQHTNLTACSTLQSHPQYVHFSKVPCSIVDSPAGAIVLGASMANGLASKGIDSLSQCIKKCATAGPGILASATAQANVANQACFAIDYDFSTHTCYFFGANILTTSTFLLNCIFTPANQPIPASQGTTPNPNVIHIQFCPRPAG